MDGKDVKYWKDRLELGNEMYHKGNLENAISILKEVSMDISSDSEMLETCVEAKHILMKCYMIQGDYDGLFSSYRVLSGLMGKIDDTMLLSETHKRVGTMWWRMGFHHSALEEYFHALRIAEESNDMSLISGILIGIGLVKSELGNYRDAEEQFRKALSIYDNKKLSWRDRQNRGSCYNNLGMNYEYQGRYQEAKKEFERMIQVGVEENNMAHEEIGRVNLARVQTLLGQNEEAKENLDMAEKLDQSVNSQEMLGGVFLVKALISLNENDMHQAKNHYERANTLLKDNLNSAGHAIVTYVWGRSLVHMGYESEAIVHLEEAATMFWDVGNETLALQAENLIHAR